MCPSRLPSEVTSYRPSGMLDRDQRTAFTIHRIRDGPSIIPTTMTSFTNSLHQRNNRLNLNHHQCNDSENSMNNGLANDEAKDLCGADKCTCDLQQKNVSGALWEDSSMASIHLTRNYKPTSGYCRSRTKFFNYLLVFICIWLASIHHTCAYPLPRAAMSDETDQDSDTQRCMAIKNALKRPILQAKIASDYIPGILNGYTQAQFKKQPSEVHNEWRHHPPHFHYDPKMEQYQLKDLNGPISEELYNHLSGKGVPSKDVLSTELQKIYAYFQTLKEVLTKIQDYRKVNASQNLHHLNNNREQNELINKFFDELLEYSNQNINEIHDAMIALKIPHPSVKYIIEEKDHIVGGWLTAREYIKILQYVTEAYSAIQNSCS